MSGSLTLRFSPETPLKLASTDGSPIRIEVAPITVTVRLDLGLSDISAGVAEAVLAQLKPLFAQQETHMAELDDRIAELTAAASQDTDAVNAAVVVINGIGAEVEAAVAAALAAGATPEQLAAVSAVRDTLSANAATLATAIANVPPPPAA